jgi:hypothetical protein
MVKEKYVRPAIDSTDVEMGVYGNGYECVPDVADDDCVD